MDYTTLTMIKTNRKNKGFTLVEMIVTLLTVTMVTSLFLVLTELVRKTYVEMEELSESQVLCSTITNKIQDELRYASAVELIDSSDGVSYDFTYYSPTIKSGPNCKLVDTYDLNGIGDGAFVKEDSINVDKDYKSYISIKDSNGTVHNVVGEKSYIFNLEALIDVKYNTELEQFDVVVRIVDSKKYNNNSELYRNEFKVIPLNRHNLVIHE